MSNEENIINIDQFMNVDLRVAKIIEAKKAHDENVVSNPSGNIIVQGLF